MASQVTFTLPKQTQLPSHEIQYLRFLLQEQEKPKSKTYTLPSEPFVPQMLTRNMSVKRKSIINKPIKRTTTLMPNYTNHYVDEDRKLKIKQKFIKSSSAMAFSKLPNKRQSFYGEMTKTSFQKRRKSTLGSTGFKGKYKSKSKQKQLIQEEYIFVRPKPSFAKDIEQRRNKEKSMLQVNQLGTISSESNNSQIIDFKRQKPKKDKKIFVNRSNSNVHLDKKLEEDKRPNSSYKIENKPQIKKRIFNKQFYDPFNKLKNKINQEFQELKKEKYPFYPPIKYPDLKVNPFRIPSIPNPPSSNFSLTAYIEIAKELCRKFKLQIHQYEDFLIKRFKNCIIFQIQKQNKTVIWHYSGKLYIGGWQFLQTGQGKKMGQGLQYYPQGDCYKGQFSNNLRHGLGTLLERNGNVYQGYWKNGLKDGRGVYYEQCKNRYSYTNWKNGKRTGFGTFQFSKKHFYQGDIENSIPEGNGIWVFQNGDIYRGSLKNGRFHGMGRYQWHSGSFYYGQFVNGMKEGIGFWRSKKSGGDIFYGQYKKNQKQGYGVYEQKRGQVYRGYFESDQRQGKGILQFPNGSFISGFWTKNALCQIQQRIIEVTHESDSQSENGMQKLLKQHIQPQYTKVTSYK